MNGTNLKNRSRTNWEAIEQKSDEEIDTSDIPPLGDDFFARAEWQLPGQPVVALVMEPDVLQWFKAQGGDFRGRINAALRIYAEAHRAL